MTPIFSLFPPSSSLPPLSNGEGDFLICFITSMETLLAPSSVAIVSSSSSSSSTFPVFSPKRTLSFRPLHSPLASTVQSPSAPDFSSSNPVVSGRESDADPLSDSTDINSLPVLSSRHHYLLPLSKDAAMGMVLSAATGRGWTTGSGMEGPSVPAGIETKSGTESISTLPWSLFTKSPRRRMRVAFTCNICGQRTTRAINPHAYTEGTVFVQCCGCNAYHKLVDNLNLFYEMKCYVDPSFNYRSNGWGNIDIKYVDEEDGSDDIFPI